MLAAVVATVLVATACSHDRPDQRLDWGACAAGPGDTTGTELDQAGAQCATVTVPLDYRRPDGAKIEIAISRVRGSDTEHRIGSMLLNDGGPGAPSLGMPLVVKPAMGAIGERFDLIGVDVRGVGRSAPVDCDWPTGAFSVFSAGATRTSFDRMVIRQRDLADKCIDKYGELLAHITTHNIARDLDAVREALGENTISYLGYSHGTYLGSTYGQLYPDRLDRVVLDGVVDPDEYSPRLLLPALAENQRALEHWAEWVARRDAEYHLGATPADVVALVTRVIATAAEKPLRIGEFELDDTLAPFVLVGAVADDRDEARSELAAQVALLRRAADGAAVQPTPAMEQALLFATTGAESAYGSGQAAILCGDGGASRDIEQYWTDVQRVRAEYPLFGPVVANVNPCAFWPPSTGAPATRIDRDVPAMLLGATGDPRTRHAAAVAVRARMSSSRLVTIENSDRHGIYGDYGNECANRHVNEYLATGTLPAHDLTCPSHVGS